MNNWGKEYNKMAEENEFYGLPYDDNTDKLIKQFISDLRKKDLTLERKMKRSLAIRYLIKLTY